MAEGEEETESAALFYLGGGCGRRRGVIPEPFVDVIDKALREAESGGFAGQQNDTIDERHLADGAYGIGEVEFFGEFFDFDTFSFAIEVTDDGCTGFMIQLFEFVDPFPRKKRSGAKSLGKTKKSEKFFVPELIGVHISEGIHPDSGEGLGSRIFALGSFADFLNGTDITEIFWQSEDGDELNASKDAGCDEKGERFGGRKKANSEDERGDGEFNRPGDDTEKSEPGDRGHGELFLGLQSLSEPASGLFFFHL